MVDVDEVRAFTSPTFFYRWAPGDCHGNDGCQRDPRADTGGCGGEGGLLWDRHRGSCPAARSRAVLSAIDVKGVGAMCGCQMVLCRCGFLVEVRVRDFAFGMVFCSVCSDCHIWCGENCARHFHISRTVQ
jgi:hypothetical protein